MENKSTAAFRLIVDCRQINKVILAPSRIALPTKTDVAKLLRGKLCSSLDLKDYFYPIYLSNNSSKCVNFYNFETV